MESARYLTLVWPGLPWLWLRGSFAGLVLAIAFAVTVDVAILTTFIWSDLVEFSFTLAVWTATAIVWIVSTVSAVAAFPPLLPQRLAAEIDPLFVRARAAYLARDWVVAETRLRELLGLAPTDAEAQLLLVTLLRRSGRRDEARRGLEKLSQSDSGARWSRVIASERARIESSSEEPAEADEPAMLALADRNGRPATGSAGHSEAA